MQLHGGFDVVSSLGSDARTRKTTNKRSVAASHKRKGFDVVSSLSGTSKPHTIDDALATLSSCGGGAKGKTKRTASIPLAEHGNKGFDYARSLCGSQHPEASSSSSAVLKRPAGTRIGTCLRSHPQGKVLVTPSCLKKPAAGYQYFNDVRAPRKRDVFGGNVGKAIDSNSFIPKGCSNKNRKFFEKNKNSAGACLENAAKCRVAAKKFGWLCSPELKGTLGEDEAPWVCSKCQREGSAPSRLYNPRACMACKSFKGNPADSTVARRRDILIGLGIMKGVAANRRLYSNDPDVQSYMAEYASRFQGEVWHCPHCIHTEERGQPYFTNRKRNHLKTHGKAGTKEEYLATTFITQEHQLRLLNGSIRKAKKRAEIWNEKKPSWACHMQVDKKFAKGKVTHTEVKCKHCKRFTKHSTLIRCGCPALASLYPKDCFEARSGQSLFPRRAKYMPNTFQDGSVRDPFKKLSSKGRLTMCIQLKKLWFEVGREVDEMNSLEQIRNASARTMFALLPKKRQC